MGIKLKHHYVILPVILLIYVILSSRLTLILWSDEASYLESYITLNKTKHGPFMYYFGHLIFLISKIFTLGNIVFYIYLFKIVSIIFGLLTLILIFLITKNIYDNKTALLATFLCAIMPMFIQFGKAILFEMPQLFFTCAVLYLYILFIKKNDTKLLLIMALCLIISAIIRINGLAPIIPIFFDCVSRKRDKKVIICLVAAVLISVIIHLLYTDYLIGIIIHGLALYMETLNPFIQLNYYMKIFHPIGLILIILSLFFVIFLQDECSEFLLSYILIGF